MSSPAARPRPPAQVVIRAAAGERAADLVGITVSASDPLVSRMFGMRGAEMIDDLSALVPVEWHTAEFGPAVVVPLRAGNEVSGVLLAMREQGGQRFVREHVPFLASFADQASLALELAAKHRAQRQLDVLEDRLHSTQPGLIPVAVAAAIATVPPQP